MPTIPATPVAQYLRMSTDLQQYSMANQATAILQYAANNNMEIVKTYADHGKSGLDLARRTGLQQLLADAASSNVDFEAVLVYDVSRWGRFQNPDEAASHEFLLLRANILVHYCAEQFPNDGSLASSILKTLKRGMAGEYSRELSGKVWAGNCRIAKLGFHVGGYPGYGLRRQLIGKDRAFKQLLAEGERKSLQTEHVILVPGPQSEIDMVHQIYSMYIEDAISEREIAKSLNARGIAWVNSRPWTRDSVREILTNPKYIGISVYNRTSFKLQKQRVGNPRSDWIWCADAFEAVVSRERFEQAHNVSVARSRVESTADLLDGLKALIKREGRVNARLIDAAEGIPSSGTYARRFGSVRTAYELVNWHSDRQKNLLGVKRATREAAKEMVAQVSETLSVLSPRISVNRNTYLYSMASGFTISLGMARCTCAKLKLPFWHVFSRENLPAHLRIVGRLTLENDGLMDYFIFPNGILKNSRLSLGTLISKALNPYHFDNLDFLVPLLSSSDAESLLWQDWRHGTRIEFIPQQGSRSGRLAQIRAAMNLLIADEDFRNLLRVESRSEIPDVFRPQNSRTPDVLAAVVCEEFITQLLKSSRVGRFLERRYGQLLKGLSPEQATVIEGTFM